MVWGVCDGLMATDLSEGEKMKSCCVGQMFSMLMAKRLRNK